MAGAAMAKKKQGPFIENRGIWLNDVGTLSFGLAADGEFSIEKTAYDDLKTKSIEDRVKHWQEMKTKKEEAKTSPPAETKKE